MTHPPATAVLDAVEVPEQRVRRAGWRRPLAALLVAAPVGWLLFTFTHLLVSGRLWWWLPAELLPPLAFLVVPVLLGLAALPCRRSRWPAAVASAGALVLGFGLGGLNLTAVVADRDPVPASALRVVAWNTEYWHDAGEADQFYSLLRAQDADVYLLQEYLYYPAGVPVRIDELARIRAALPGYHIAVAGELMTLSRHPIVAQRGLEAPELDVPADTDFPEYWRYKTLRTDLLLGGKLVSVYNVHLPTPVWFGGPSLFTPAFWDGVEDQHLRRGPHLRALARDVAANRNPVLVAGDLNTTPAMGDRHRFPSGLRDAAYANDSPYPASWPAAGPLPAWWRLDWTLVSPEVVVHRYRFGDPAGLSDHRLQYVEVSP